MSENSADMDAVSGDVDMFGVPIGPIRDRRGRPSFAKTKENQELVALLISAGWTQERIARYIGCDEKTLRKYFSRELREGADLIEATCLQVALKRARTGHLPSVNRLLDVIENRGRPAPPAPESKSGPREKVGKKEQANRDAQTAHQETGWGDLLH